MKKSFSYNLTQFGSADNTVTEQIKTSDGIKTITTDANTGAVILSDQVDEDSLNPVTGAAVATAIAQGGGGVPEYDAEDANKVLKVDAQGEELVWGTAGGSYTAGNGIDITGDEISVAIGSGGIQIDFSDNTLMIGDADYHMVYVDDGSIKVRHDSTISESVDGDSNGQLGVANPVPTPGANDANKVLTVSDANGNYGWASAPTELPSVTGNAGKVLTVNSGATGVEWASAGGGSDTPLPALSSSDCLRFEFESPDFDPTSDPAYSQFTWVQVQVPGRNIWDWDHTGSSTYTSVFSNKFTDNPCSIIDGNIGNVSGYFDKDFSTMFYGCTGLRSACFTVHRSDSSMCNMNGMFSGCTTLESVHLRNDYTGFGIDTSAASMFNGCSKLTSFTFANDDGGDTQFTVKSTAYLMFADCMSLQKIDGSVRFYTYSISDAMNMSHAFARCWQLESISDLSMWGTVYISDAVSMFQQCYKLNKIPAVNFHITGTDTTYMFSNCTVLGGTITAYIENVNTTEGMFRECRTLQHVVLYDPVSIQNMSTMFYECNSLCEVPKDIGHSASSLTNMDYAFYNTYHVDDGAQDLYNSVSASSATHNSTFTNCGSQTYYGSLDLANIPSSWGGTGA